jgi:dolichol-phosphate mannosyltransferase
VARERVNERLMKLSIVIPAHDEVESIRATLDALTTELKVEDIPYEIIVVDDASEDGTAQVVREVAEHDPHVRCVRSPRSPGFGQAVRCGLEEYTGDAIAIVMADLSDSPKDLVRYYRVLEEGFDCAFGSRFIRGGRVSDYPKFKLALNRLVNLGIRVLFRHGYNDTTNAFKAYRREVIDNVQPLLSHHFNLTVELPLKAIVRGHTYAITPVSWSNRTRGVSKLKLQEMGSRYLFIVLYVFLEHHLSRGDYQRPGKPGERRHRPRPGVTHEHRERHPSRLIRLGKQR